MAVTKVRLGDVIRGPHGEDSWRRVRETGFDILRKGDDSGEFWDLFVFFGPLVEPSVEPGTRPGFGRFIFREDEPVIRRTTPDPHEAQVS